MSNRLLEPTSLRPYQSEAARRVDAYWRRAPEELLDHINRVVLLGAGGSGKTTIMSRMALEELRKGERVLCLQNRELGGLQQLRQQLTRLSETKQEAQDMEEVSVTLAGQKSGKADEKHRLIYYHPNLRPESDEKDIASKLAARVPLAEISTVIVDSIDSGLQHNEGSKDFSLLDEITKQIAVARNAASKSPLKLLMSASATYHRVKRGEGDNERFSNREMHNIFPAAVADFVKPQTVAMVSLPSREDLTSRGRMKRPVFYPISISAANEERFADRLFTKDEVELNAPVLEAITDRFKSLFCDANAQLIKKPIIVVKDYQAMDMIAEALEKSGISNLKIEKIKGRAKDSIAARDRFNNGESNVLVHCGSLEGDHPDADAIMLMIPSMGNDSRLLGARLAPVLSTKSNDRNKSRPEVPVVYLDLENSTNKDFIESVSISELKNHKSTALRSKSESSSELNLEIKNGHSSEYDLQSKWYEKYHLKISNGLIEHFREKDLFNAIAKDDDDEFQEIVLYTDKVLRGLITDHQLFRDFVEWTAKEGLLKKAATEVYKNFPLLAGIKSPEEAKNTLIPAIEKFGLKVKANQVTRTSSQEHYAHQAMTLNQFFNDELHKFIDKDELLSLFAYDDQKVKIEIDQFLDSEQMQTKVFNKPNLRIDLRRAMSDFMENSFLAEKLFDYKMQLVLRTNGSAITHYHGEWRFIQPEQLEKLGLAEL